MIERWFDIITILEFGSIPLVFVKSDFPELVNFINGVGVNLSELSCFIFDVKILFYSLESSPFCGVTLC